MKKQTTVFLALLLICALIAVFLPGILLRLQDSGQVEQLNYVPSKNYNFRSDEQRLSLLERLNAAFGGNGSIVQLDFEAVSHTYGERDDMIALLNRELDAFCAAVMPSMPEDMYPQLPEDSYLHFEYILDNATMQGFMFCVAECSLSQGDMYLIMDMESKRLVQLELYKTPMFPKIYDYFTLRISDNLAGYLSLSLVESEFSVDTLNMLLEGGGQAGKMIFTDDNQEFAFSFSCWQDGLILYPGT